MKYLLALFLLLSVSACEKVLIAPDPVDDPFTNFESMWETLDQRYSFFPTKNINWDSIYQVYRPRVQADMEQEELFDLLSQMLFELRDGHVNLFSEFDFTRYWLWYQDYPYNFNRNILEQNYWDAETQYTGPLINAVIDSIGYIYYGSFSSHISSSDLDHVLERFQGLKGVIIDVRQNGGGSVGNARRLAARFADQKRTAYFTFYRNGPEHDDFQDPPFVTSISPQGDIQFTKPVVVLINRRCYSATTAFAQMMRIFPHVTLVGDSTGGGGGIPHYYELPNGWRYRFSVSLALDPEGYNLENGIPADVDANLDPEDEAEGVDSMLETALELLK